MSAEVWTDIGDRDRFAKSQNRKRETPLIDALTQEGFTVVWFSPYHCRVNGRLDLFPSTGKWHDTSSNTRGASGDLAGWVRSRVEEIKAKSQRRREAKMPVHRLYNLKTASWASWQRHTGPGANDSCLRERIQRVRAADPKVRELARAALLQTIEDDAAYIARRQATFDKAHPRIAQQRQPA